MNGRKAKTLRRIANEKSSKPGNLGYRERKVPYSSVDRNGKPETKHRRTIQLMYHPRSAPSIYRRLKKAYARSPEMRRGLAR